MGSHTTPTARSRSWPPSRWRSPGAAPACSPATHCSAGRWTWSRPHADARSTAASARSSRCEDATSIPIRSIGSSTTSWMPGATAPGPSSWWTTTSRWTCAASSALCEAIIERGLNDSDYVVQAMTAPLAEHGATLAPLMRRAGFRYVFLGIENVLESDLAFLKAGGEERPRATTGGRSGTRRSPPSNTCTGTGSTSSGASSSGTPTTRASRSRRTSSSRVDTWTGRISSIRRPTRARP